MWVPTHVQVTVLRAEKLLVKGKNNTNDCFVTIALGKTKFQTSIKEKSGQLVEWQEECELPIPDQGNTAEIVLTVLHHNYLGIDEFLGRVNIPLNTLDVYERPKNKWFKLESKAGKPAKSKERGNLEVKIRFSVKSGSLTNLSKREKHKSSVSTVAHSLGGSLMSLGSAEKRKGIKKFAKSIGSKINLRGKKKDHDDDGSSIGSIGSLNIRGTQENFKSKQSIEDADPGVVSDDDDFTLDDLSHKSSASSLNHPVVNRTASPILKNHSVENISHVEKKNTLPPIKPPRNDQKEPSQDEWESKLLGNKPRGALRPGSSESLNRRSWDSSKLASQIEEEPAELLEIPKKNFETISLRSTKSPETPRKEAKEGMFSKFKNFRKDKNDFLTENDKPSGNSSQRIIIGGETETKVTSHNNRISNELQQKFEGKSREDLILSLVETQNDLEKQKKKLKDLEDYLDDLLLRVMETSPRILQNPYVTCKMAVHSKMTG